ncbi:MAG: hypothetical protein AB7O45_11055 [Alphaproteobacteria bacterium]
MTDTGPPAGRSLLIVATESDPHADAVVEALGRAGFDDFLRLDASRADRANAIEAHPADGRWRIAVRARPERFVDSRSVRAVYLRRLAGGSDVMRLFQPDAETLDRAETFAAVRWLVESLPAERFPFGHPIPLLAAENKLRQLAVARAVGLRTPETLYGNEAETLARFAEARGEVAVKPLANPILVDEGYAQHAALYAARRPGTDLAQAIRARGQTQLYLQGRIAKRADLRLMVFPGRVLGCEIETGILGAEAMDWRPEIPRIPHRIVPVPADLEAKARAYLAAIGIGAGYFDFAVLDDGSHVFFECNPNAEWTWIARRTGHPVADEIAAELVAAVRAAGAAEAARAIPTATAEASRSTHNGAA